MSGDDSDLKLIVEAALFAAEVPLSVRRLQELFPDDARPEREEIEAVIEELRKDCENRGIELVRTGGGYRYHTRERLAPWLRRLHDTRPPRYSRALLETLAIIAYRQPVTRGEIEDIRGVSVSSDIMRVLQEREWIRQVGVKEVPGRPGLYGTTRAFLEYFNLRGLSELPALIEQRDMAEVARELNLELPFEEWDSGSDGGGEPARPATDDSGGEGLDTQPDPDDADGPERPVTAPAAAGGRGDADGEPTGANGGHDEDGHGSADGAGEAVGPSLRSAHPGPVSAVTEDDPAVRG